MMMPSLTQRSAAMCFRALRAYCCPGPGSSDAIRLMATCASVKTATRSGTVFEEPGSDLQVAAGNEHM